MGSSCTQSIPDTLAAPDILVGGGRAQGATLRLEPAFLIDFETFAIVRDRGFQPQFPARTGSGRYPALGIASAAVPPGKRTDEE